MQSIQFQNSLDDLQDFHTYYAFETSQGRKWTRQLHLNIQAIYILGGVLVWAFTRNLWVTFGLLLIFELGLYIRTGLQPGKWNATRIMKDWLKPFTGDELDNFLLPKTLDISDEALSVHSDNEAHSFAWKRVKKIEKSSKNIFIYCGMRTVFIVPQRAFSSQNEFDDLATDLRAMLKGPLSTNFPLVGDTIIN